MIQPSEDVVAAEGDDVTLNCTFQSSSNNLYIFWYKQEGIGRPKFILSRFSFGQGKTENEFRERFSSTLDSKNKSAPLKIQKVQLSDSAVYYCALRPTVTGTSRTVHKNLRADATLSSGR